MIITAIVGCIIFGGLAWLWRNKWQTMRVHGFLAFGYAVLSWFLSWLLGLYIFLEILESGPVGNIITQVNASSFIVAFISYSILRKKNDLKKNSPKETNISSKKTDQEDQVSENNFDHSKPTKRIVEVLTPYYEEILLMVKNIDGQVKHHYEIGIYIASIATIEILSFKTNDPEKLADEFNTKWVDYISNKENIDKAVLTKRLQENYPKYRELFLRTLEAQNDKEKLHNKSVQLIWELYSNATDTESPKNFLGLTISANKLTSLSIDCMNKLKSI